MKNFGPRFGRRCWRVDESTVDYDFSLTGHFTKQTFTQIGDGWTNSAEYVRSVETVNIWTCQRCLCLTSFPEDHFTAMHLSDSVLGVEDLVIER